MGEERFSEMTEERAPMDEIEVSREVRFVGGGKYEGTWNTIDKTGIGRYITSHGATLQGEYRNGMLHGHGSVRWPRGQTMDGTWTRGRMEEKRYTFADGLPYRQDEWNYCAPPDRRFYDCVVNGLRPAGKVLKTSGRPTKIIPPFSYDTGDGIFDPDNNCVISYHNNRKIIRIPTKAESKWIKENCRKGWSQPIGHQEWLHEYWRSGVADFAMLPEISQEDKTKNWWQRLTKFARHSPADTINRKCSCC